MLGASRRHKWKSVSELSRSFRYLADDLIWGRKFWVPVATGIIPTIVAAMVVSSNTSRLVVELTVHQPTYLTKKHPVTEPLTFARVMNHMLHDRIADRVNEVFPLPTPPVEGDKESGSGNAKPGFGEGKDKTPTPNGGSGKKESGSALAQTPETGADTPWWDSPPTIANEGKKDAPRKLDQLDDHVFAKISAKIRVTNIGSLSSTIRAVAMYIVEEIDGHRETWESHIEDDLEIKVPQGQSIEIGGGRGKSIIFPGTGTLFLDYEGIKLLGESLAKLKPKEKNRYSYAIPFLQLLGVNAEDSDRLLKIANPETRSRLLLVVEVWDVYGRRGSAEEDLMNSSGYMREKPSSDSK
jgi:hypothetical protein